MSVRWSEWTPNRASRDITIGVALGIALSISFTSLSTYIERRRRIEREKLEGARDYVPRPIELRSDEIVDGVVGLIGNTPLMRINSLSEALGVDILGKAEFLNPGGSVKDRVALKIIQDAELQGFIHPNSGSRIFEGTVGSTGISIATIAKARGYETTIIMPDDVAAEKERALLALGATVEKVRPASIVDKKQFVNLAKHRALEFGKTEMHTSDDSMVASTRGGPEKSRGFFADQFESPSNYQAHLQSTGPELWRQCSGRLDAFVSGAGTGGTVAGVGRYLKSQDKNIHVVLSDPEGSGLYNKIKSGVMFDVKEAEGTKRRHQVDTVVEGIGINRLTQNFEMALGIIDDAIRVSDKEAVAMSRYLVQNDGLFLGSSSACNLVACIKVAKEMKRGSGKVIATILCDSGTRHYSKFWNDEYLEKAGIEVDVGIVERMLKD
ncbi:cysteine synthase A [Rhizoctonia solani AG-1 IB]|uniref:cysteine synthase n=1 Tax=Thanatephorus cucumeris (strain AG1-IB / isolate 7/3/14) TaxID=1108050 RepID=A0A0B7FWT9_THACB|nr:cysteine synthase A [Rhizoctonia solani AG-1 IB]